MKIIYPDGFEKGKKIAKSEEEAEVKPEK